MCHQHQVHLGENPRRGRPLLWAGLTIIALGSLQIQLHVGSWMPRALECLLEASLFSQEDFTARIHAFLEEARASESPGGFLSAEVEAKAASGRSSQTRRVAAASKAAEAVKTGADLVLNFACDSGIPHQSEPPPTRVCDHRSGLQDSLAIPLPGHPLWRRRSLSAGLRAPGSPASEQGAP